MSRCRQLLLCAQSTPCSSCHMSRRSVSGRSGTSSSSDGGECSSSKHIAVGTISTSAPAENASLGLLLGGAATLPAILSAALSPAPSSPAAQSSSPATSGEAASMASPPEVLPPASPLPPAAPLLLLPPAARSSSIAARCDLGTIQSRGGCLRLVSMRSNTSQSASSTRGAALSSTMLGCPLRCCSVPSSRSVLTQGPSPLFSMSAHLMATRRPVRRSRPRKTLAPGGSRCCS
mmetsp:Transcript_6189/g.18551  ORF Transcript_6189/g.18551 Transcript_6189/m.18551 type:complete len:233 (-) Transcript_6189:627-1325(-)